MVGILFSTIIPLFIFVNSVDNYYDSTVVSMDIADQERKMEAIDVYAWGSNETGNDIDVLLENKGSITINITRVWVTRTDLERTLVFTSDNESSLPLQLIASGKSTIDSLDLTPILESNETDYFNIEVMTARGNKFPSKTNPLHSQPCSPKFCLFHGAFTSTLLLMSSFYLFT